LGCGCKLSVAAEGVAAESVAAEGIAAGGVAAESAKNRPPPPPKGGPLRETPDAQSHARSRRLAQNPAVFGWVFAIIRIVASQKKLLLGGLELSGHVPI
jgi:hypothetical protein